MNKHGNFITKEDSLLLVVDIQESMLGGCVSPDTLKFNAGALLDFAEVAEIPVIFSVHNPEKLGEFMPEMTDKIENPVVLPKMEFGCFENTEIEKAVHRTGRKSIILIGLETHICIFHTGVQALAAGYSVHVVSDAVTAFSLSNHKVGLGRMEKAGAVASSTEMVIFELLNRADSPAFRPTLPIIKALRNR